MGGAMVAYVAKLAVGVIVSVAVAGCSEYDHYSKVSIAVPPRTSGPAEPIQAALACIRASGALRGTRIAVAIHADGTGKSNHAAEGSTGNFLPQGTSAVWASEAVLLAGGQAYNYYELNTERAMRAFGNEATLKALAAMQEDALADYVVSTSFTALDFVGGFDMDVRVDGMGPRMVKRGVAIEGAAEVYEPGSRKTLYMSSIRRRVRFKEVAFGLSRFFGGGQGILVTGGVAHSDQQRLQEATRDVIALAVADVLSRFPRVPASCWGEVEALKSGAGWQAAAEPDHRPAKVAYSHD